MEPIPETVRAIEEYGPFVIEGEDLLAELQAKAALVVELVPQSVGLSLASNLDEATFTLVASDHDVAVLDAIQYLDRGPCVEAVAAEKLLTYRASEPLDEEAWRLFARATAARSVASTLSLPIIEQDRVIGSVNLYASTKDAFDGKHEMIAQIFNAWAPGAVMNADLSFTTRTTAQETLIKLLDDVNLAVASEMVAAIHDVTHDEGRLLLGEAAQRADVPVADLARTIVELDWIGETDAE